MDEDFSLSLGNAKELLETIGKEICHCLGKPLSTPSSINGIIKNAFSALGYTNTNLVNRISSALATIAQQVGELRNEITGSGHGGTLEELRERNNKVDTLTRELLIDSVEVVCCMLIKAFEIKKKVITNIEDIPPSFEEAQDFNDFWDDLFGTFEMGEYSYSASEILFHVDKITYMIEYRGYQENLKLSHDPHNRK